MGDWKKILYSNKSGTDDATQKGVKDVDLSPSYYNSNNDGGALGDVTVDTTGAFANVSDTSNLVLKRGDGTVTGAEAGQLYWGRGSESHSVLVEDIPGTPSIMTDGTIPIATGNYTVGDSKLTFATDIFSTTGKSINAGEGQLSSKNIVLSESTNSNIALDVNNESFKVMGNGDTTTQILNSTSGTFSGLLTAEAGITADNFTVLDASGNTAIGGTLAVDGAVLFNDTTTATTAYNAAAIKILGGLGVAGALYTSSLIETTSTGKFGSNLTTEGDLQVAGDLDMNYDNATAGDIIGVNDLTMAGNLSLGGDFDHNGSSASLANGAMTIQDGSPDTGYDIKADGGTTISRTAPSTTPTTYDVTNNSGANATFTAGDTLYAVDSDNITVVFAVESTTTINDTVMADLSLTVQEWEDTSATQVLAGNTTLYTTAPDLAVLTFNQGVQFEGSAIIIDSTNTAIQDDVFHINTANSGGGYGATTTPTIVMTSSGAADSEAGVGRFVFNSGSSIFEFGEGATIAGSYPSVTGQDTAAPVTNFQPIHADAYYLEKQSGSLTSTALNDTNKTHNVIACDSLGDPYIWIP